MRRLNLDVLDALSADERVYNPRHGQRRLTHAQEKKLRKYRGADRSVTVGGTIAPPTKNAAKTAFAAQRPRLNTAIVVPSKGNAVSIPSKYGI